MPHSPVQAAELNRLDRALRSARAVTNPLFRKWPKAPVNASRYSGMREKRPSWTVSSTRGPGRMQRSLFSRLSCLTGKSDVSSSRTENGAVGYRVGRTSHRARRDG